MKRLFGMIGCAVLSAFAAFGADIAVLYGRNNSRTDFDAAINNLGFEVDRYKCNDEDMKRFCENISQYRLVMLNTLFNYAKDKNLLSDDATDYGAVRGFLKRGGVLVVTDAVYDNVNGWLDKVLDGAKIPKIGKCNSSQWAVLGHTSNVEPVASIRSFPNTITQGNSWPHYEKDIDKSWTVVAKCSEGFPVVLTRSYGKGLVVLSALRQPGDKIVENNYAAAQLRSIGVDIKKFSISPVQPGPGNISIELTEKAPKGANLVYEVIDSKNKKTSFSTNFVGASASLDYNLSVRGDVTLSLYISSDKSNALLFKRHAKFPMLLEVSPPAYRGIISTKRRLPTVAFRVKFSPINENLHGAQLKLEFFDSLSNCVYSVQKDFPKDRKEKIETDFYMDIELPKSLSDGEYELRAALSRYRAKCSVPFRILAPRPAQAVIDEDKTFLVNGVPFFPLGIYHPAGNYTNIASIGFNTIQFWKWDMRHDKYGVPTGLYNAYANGLRVLFESNHHGGDIYRAIVKSAIDHPALLMWYVMDEPSEGAEAEMHHRNSKWHQYDIHHPTYVLSCREDLFGLHQQFGDVFAFDPYGGFDKAIQWMKTATAVTDNRKALICVPWATPEDVKEIRPMAYAALVHDARGIIWYCWKQAGGGPLGIGLNTRKDCMAEYTKLLAEIKTLFPGLLSINRRTFEEGDIHGIVCGDVNAKDKRFAILLNVSKEKREVELALPELAKVKAVKDHLSDADVTITEGKLKASFEPRGVRIFRW